MTQKPQIFKTNIAKCNTTRAVDFYNLPKISQDYIIQYGLTKSLNDCHASEKEAEHAIGLVDKRLDALEKGIPPANGGGSRLDPVTKVAIELFAIKIAQAKRFTKKEAMQAIRKEIDESTELGLIMVSKAEEKIALDAKFNLDVELDI